MATTPQTQPLSLSQGRKEGTAETTTHTHTHTHTHNAASVVSSLSRLAEAELGRAGRRDDRAEASDDVAPEDCAERDEQRGEEELDAVLRGDVAVADRREREDGEVERDRVSFEQSSDENENKKHRRSTTAVRSRDSRLS